MNCFFLFQFSNLLLIFIRSILNFYPTSGSFQAFPPDSEDLIDASITHFEKLLENSREPLSFILFIQQRPKFSSDILSKLENNKFKRMQLKIAANEHQFRSGLQHLINSTDVVQISQTDTVIYFLQNDGGFLNWGPTPERIEELTESFVLDRDKEVVYFGSILCLNSFHLIDFC